MAGRMFGVVLCLLVVMPYVTCTFQNDDGTDKDMTSTQERWPGVYKSHFKLMENELPSSFKSMRNRIKERLGIETGDAREKDMSDESGRNTNLAQGILQLVSKLSSIHAAFEERCLSSLENEESVHRQQLDSFSDSINTLSRKMTSLIQRLSAISDTIRGTHSTTPYTTPLPRSTAIPSTTPLLRSTVIPSTTSSSIKVADGTIRLVNGATENEGRLEIYHSGEWGTVCDDEWQRYRKRNAAVVCKQLGYSGSGQWNGSAPYGGGDGPIWMDDVVCDQKSTSLQDCKFSGWGRHNCGHDEDVGVVCYPLGSTSDPSPFPPENVSKVSDRTLSTTPPTSTTTTPIEGDIRLVGGQSDSEGRLEIYYNDQWSAVCNDDWFVDTNSVVVCHQLGYRGGQHHLTRFGESDVSYWIDDVICIGTEERLADCRFSARDYESCYDKDNSQVRVLCDTDAEQAGSEEEDNGLELGMAQVIATIG
ncbi:neurotrypsin-like [Pecten maximus]|uniref:neurotrypsin-like n=1 Tax=Pecten maximus TaxID=6579 RepID=UPI001458930F|nr:neurotrypsin-like [Pecten maximus]